MNLASFVLAALTCTAAASPAQDLLVAMSGSGKVERYDPQTGSHLGTFISGLASPNALLAASCSPTLS